MCTSAAEPAARPAANPKPEFRAVWNHSGMGAYPGDWARTAKVLASNRFNAILPNMLWAGRAHYASDVLPRSEVFRRYGDQLAQCVAAAKAQGLEIHVWKVNYYLAGAPKEFIDRLRREGRTQVTAGGQPLDWLCPSHPENQQLELRSMVEVARKYAVTGLHFDYIRYPGSHACFCDGCRRRFEAHSGRAVAQWPADCRQGDRREEYNDWRCRQITQLVAAVRAETRRVRPDLKLSAAVWGAYPDCRRSVAQDWPEWVRAGYLDFICPMNYTADENQMAGWLRNQIRLVEGRVPIYTGIGATASRPRLSVEQVLGQIRRAQGLGAAGFCLFDLDQSTAESLLPGLAERR